MKNDNIPSLSVTLNPRNVFAMLKTRLFELVYFLINHWKPSFTSEILFIIYQGIQLLTFPFNPKVFYLYIITSIS